MCEFCNIVKMDDKVRGQYVNGFYINESLQLNHVSQPSYYGIYINHCPKCGRELNNGK